MSSEFDVEHRLVVESPRSERQGNAGKDISAGNEHAVRRGDRLHVLGTEAQALDAKTDAGDAFVLIALDVDTEHLAVVRIPRKITLLGLLGRIDEDVTELGRGNRRDGQNEDGEKMEFSEHVHSPLPHQYSRWRPFVHPTAEKTPGEVESPGVF
jgi:hypothetical protein